MPDILQCTWFTCQMLHSFTTCEFWPNRAMQFSRSMQDTWQSREAQTCQVAETLCTTATKQLRSTYAIFGQTKERNSQDAIKTYGASETRGSHIRHTPARWHRPEVRRCPRAENRNRLLSAVDFLNDFDRLLVLPQLCREERHLDALHSVQSVSGWIT